MIQKFFKEKINQKELGEMRESNKCEFQEKVEVICTGAAFILFVLISCYKLTNASLWFDETIEYWYSKIMFGPVPFEDTVNMYQRIVTTFQPPLYNFILFFWLRISDSEWWFRFFGVVCGFIGMVGIYKSVKKISNNALLSSGAVFFASFIVQLVYYWQECGEYCLMLGSLCWTIYFWISLIQYVNRKNIVFFTIFAIVPVYSQYGAVFPVFAMCLMAYAYVLSTRNKKNIIEISVAYFGALMCAALPLYLFFLKKQMLNQQGELVTLRSFWGKGLIWDFFKSLIIVFKWNMASNHMNISAVIIVVIALLAALAVFIWGKSLAKLLVAVNAITWISYYICVKLSIYSYGSFGRRYNLFFIPLWIISIFAICNEIYLVFQRIDCLKRINAHTIFMGTAACLTGCYCLLCWVLGPKNNWSKENIRGAVAAWYQQTASEMNTIVYYGADSGFSYYVRVDKRYNDETEKNVAYMHWYNDKSEEEYLAYINSIYGEIWPQEIYIVGSHMSSDFDTFISAFTDRGYIGEDVYNLDGGRLMKLTYTQSDENL